MVDADPNAISQKIFQMGLSVETVSVYLLCCGLAEAGTLISHATLKEIWNGTPEQLTQALNRLEDRDVLVKLLSESEENAVYRLKDPDNWKCH
jgi:hypothetical protein